jgi:hypothetical protein
MNAIPASRQFMARFEKWYERYFLIIFAVGMVLLWLNEVFVYYLSGHWDWLFISGVVIAFLGLRLGILLPAQMGRMLGRLRVSGSLVLKNGVEQVLSEEQLKTFRGSFETRSARWARNGGIGGIVIILLSILAISYYRKDLSNIIGNFGDIITNLLDTIFLVGFVIFLAVEICGGYGIGYYLGYAASNGGLGHLLKQQALVVKAQPGHPDRAAGLRPVGNLYFWQAMLLAIPALFLAGWWVLIGVVPYFTKLYAQWRAPYLIMFALVVITEVLAFVGPLWSFHQAMQVQKTTLLEEADTLGQGIVSIQKELTEGLPSEKANVLKDQLAAMQQRYEAIQHMPTWPVDTNTFWKFAGGLVVQIFIAVLGALISKLLS